MKTRISIGWILGMVWTMAAATHSFAQDGLNPPPATASADATGAATLAPAPTPAAQPQIIAPPAPGNAGDKTSASEPPLSAWSHEVQRLTQAGLDERVILAYISNSPGIFELSSDNIIQLSNLGVSAQAINAMIVHDQELVSRSLRITSQASAPPATIVMPLDPPGHPPIIADDGDWASEGLVLNDNDYAPDQPEGVGPVRVPYAVKLNDPIIIFKLPTIRLQCW